MLARATCRFLAAAAKLDRSTILTNTRMTSIRSKRVRLGPTSEDAPDAILIEARRQLKTYFAGDLKVFTLRLDFRGTDFQRNVWEALLTIPFGETRSYSDIARQIAKPKASRAVGAANGRNPISIIAPCHRVVGSNGALTGFAGGIAAKEYLLRLELA